MNESINSVAKPDGLEETNGIDTLLESISSNVSILSEKGINITFNKEKFKTFLMVILGSGIFAQPVQARDLHLNWSMQGSSESLSGFQLCTSETSDRSKLDQWDCTDVPISTIPPTCTADPDDSRPSFEGTVFSISDTAKYATGRAVVNGSPGSLGTLVDLDSETPYTRMMSDFDGDGKLDLLEYKDGRLNIKYGKEGYWCIGNGKGDWDKIIENYSSGDRRIVQRNMLDDTKTDIALYDEVTGTCDIDLSNNGFGSIDLANQPCDLPNMDSIFYNQWTGVAFLALINQEGTGYTFNRFRWGTSQKIMSLKDNNNDKVLIYNPISGKVYLCTLKADNSGFDTVELNWINNLDLTDLGDLLGNGKGALLGRSKTEGEKSYILILNQVGNDFDKIEIILEEGDQIINGHFTESKAQTIIKYNSINKTVKMITVNTNLTITEKDLVLTIPDGSQLLRLNLNGAGLDDLVSYIKDQGKGEIHKIRTDGETFKSYPFSGLKLGMTLYRGDLENNGKDTLFGYNPLEREVGKGVSDACFLFSNDNGNGFTDNPQYFIWDSGLEIFVGDVDGSGGDGIKLYRKAIGTTFLLKVSLNNGKVSFAESRLNLGGGNEIITGNYDGK